MAWRPVTFSLHGLMVAAVLLLFVTDLHAQARTVRMAGPYGGQRVFAILLPPSYDSSETRYPVVYMFHGGGQDHTAWLARTAFAPMARRHEFIVVMPAADRGYSALGSEAQGQYHDFVAKDLVEYVDSHYRTIATREARAIAGLSMGGRIATMTALRHPDRFGAVGAFSAALRPDVETAMRAVAAPAPFFYVSCGTQDSLLEINRTFVALLKERTMAHQYREALGLGHVWAVWDEDARIFFDLLESKLARSG